MTAPSNFNQLADIFDKKNAEFKAFENTFLALGRKLSKEAIEENIDKFQKWLSVFTDLYTAVSKEALAEDTAGHRAKYVDWLNVLINRIQFIYLTQLSYQLNYLYNKHNLFVARVSIFIGVGLTILSLAFPYVMPNQFELDMKRFKDTSEVQHTQIINLENRLLKLQAVMSHRDSIDNSTPKSNKSNLPVKTTGH
ncbi:MAG: hypothetical protein JWR38_2858 [Mucilaginibacter sp.]|nr:hypothetical protein [Mucilaginibacter sp.]